MTQNLGTPNQPLEMHGEQWQLGVRTDDPSTTEEGEAWIRSDLAPDTDQIGTLRFDHGSGVYDIPIYSTGTSTSSVSESRRVAVNGSVGYIPLITPSDAAFDELRFVHDGTTTALHDAPGVAAFFDVSVTSTNSPVTEGEDLTVDYSVKNTGELEDTQDIRLRDFSNNTVDSDPDVSLSGSQSSSGTLIWSTSSGDAGEDYISVASDDDSSSSYVTIESAIPDSGVLRYAMENSNSDTTVTADSWNGYDGQVTGASYNSTGGPNGNGEYQLNGVDDLIDTTWNPDLSTAKSYAVLANVQTDSSSRSHLVHADDGGFDLSMFFTSSGTLSYWNGNTTINSSVGADVGTYRWYIVTFDPSSGDSRVYRDDTEVGSGGASGTSTSVNAHLGAASGNSANLHVYLADARMYNKQLSSTEVSNLVNNGSING